MHGGCLPVDSVRSTFLNDLIFFLAVCKNDLLLFYRIHIIPQVKSKRKILFD
ncbi:hypothetical protein V1514DRAFT_354395, partial [Lipomyces japonicus]|uniref:uncharacterized protein n=1 Tax=Lipomyces japonicus TaxID=56871 RepID=UPI0034CE0201